MGVYAIVKGSVVTNMVVWDGDETIWSPPKGEIAVEVTADTGPATIGYEWNGALFATPVPSTDQPTVDGPQNEPAMFAVNSGSAADSLMDDELQPTTEPTLAAAPIKSPKLLGQSKRSAGSK
ncbi:hypothetical protein KDW37_26325 [Burkholderia cenocepacia]|uniref:hypothetical protein n=1 Tax=Burkholderia cenocepacia TaxID=95486 RepID=UPI001B927DC8|nr:hypothetical protein [Burkholderia cenocepacia]MBR8434280.1 hypothetical protein [Burkholderia cenocepacia]